ncbi:MAG TPA: hypothetical protein VHG90_12285 [Acidimicrobiales bacterium]|nr:hypothetical protein [Acidimicrobiales bacterium]
MFPAGRPWRRAAAGWQTLASMAEEAAGRTYGEDDRVEAADDLPGVPKGTPGTVVMVTGLSWTRYRVAFDNGVELNLLDGRHLAPAPPRRRH